LQSIKGESFAGAGLREITIDAANPFLQVTGSFIMDESDHGIVWYFGSDENVTIGSNIEMLCSSCFTCCDVMCTVDFPPNSRVSVICAEAFSECTRLHSINIPAGLTMLGADCFFVCGALVSVLFCPGSQLRRFLCRASLVAGASTPSLFQAIRTDAQSTT
jgi:hypothetical protein